VGGLLLRLWSLEMPPSFVCGAYLLLSGLCRFVEEAYRGEPQTPRVLGLPIYQWSAVASIVAGAALTTVGGTPATPGGPLTLGSAGLFLAFALLVWLAMGVDLPESSRRFSRLA